MEQQLFERISWILLLVGLAAGLPVAPSYGAEPRSFSTYPMSWYTAQKDKSPSFPKEPQSGVSSPGGAGSGGVSGGDGAFGSGWSGVSGGGSASGWSGVSGGASAGGSSGSGWSVYGGSSAGGSTSGWSGVSGGGSASGWSGVSGGGSASGWSGVSGGGSGSGFSTGGGPGVFAGVDDLQALQELSALGSNLMGSRQMVLGQAWNDDQHVPLGTVEKRPLYPSSHVVHYNSGYQRERDGRTDQKYVKDFFIQLQSGSTSGGKGGAGPKGQQVQRVET